MGLIPKYHLRILQHIAQFLEHVDIIQSTALVCSQIYSIGWFAITFNTCARQDKL